MSILIIAEHDHQTLKPSTYLTAGAAAKLNQPMTIFVGGHNCAAVASEAATIDNVQEVLYGDHQALTHFLAEPWTDAILNITAGYDYIMAPASTFGKNILPRVAARLDVAQISDIVDIVSEDTFVRPIYAGNALATLQSHDKIKVITVRTTSFDRAVVGSERAPIKTIDAHLKQTYKTTFVKQDMVKTDRPELTSARIVVSGGRGLKSGDNFQLIHDLAQNLNAAVGASRAAVDAGYVPNDYQVGQTGKIVAPELYIAIGISGAIQHLAGMRESKIIVAINSDQDAPIFQVADYGIVGDLFQIIPELIQTVKNLKGI